MNNKTVISIDTATMIRAAVVVISILLLFVVRDILLILLVAVVLASAASPAVDLLVERKIPRVVSAGIIYATAIGMFVLFFYYFVPILASEVSGFLNSVPEYSSELSEVANSEDVEVLSLENLTEGIRNMMSNLTDGILGSIATVFGGLFNFILILTISFYLSIQKNGVDNFLAYVTPAQYSEYVANLWKNSQRKIGKWFQGTLVSSALVGLLVYTGLLILGVPYAFFFAVLSGLLNFIPIVGPTLMTIPAAIVGLVEGGLVLGVLVVVLFILVQAIEGNFVYPLVVGRAVGVSPIVIIMAVGIGAKLAGFLGVILAVPVSAVLVEFITDMQNSGKKEKETKELEGNNEEDEESEREIPT
ncbi:MAG: AI-2E family transporter [Candidatus Campbellbacteria bacterium]|nr:AI-2E family transporter [Candidatus Campbellbacteria bacterium]